MSKYIHLFNTVTDFTQVYNGDGYKEPWVSFIIENSAATYNKGPFNGHPYVDLELPSGRLWATCNVGATMPEGYGWRCAWGETATKSNYDWSTYAHGTSSTDITKYNATDGKTVLDPVDDVAHVVMGGAWRMPTQAEIQELTANTTNVWTTRNGVNGRLFTSNANGKTLFIPAGGYYNGSVQKYVGERCYLWSSSLDSNDISYADKLHFDSSSVVVYYDARCLGMGVRGVV